jgi:hypothetical protein
MKTLSEAKEILDEIRSSQEKPFLASHYLLTTPGISKDELSKIEKALGNQLPISYTEILKKWDFSSLNLGNLRFHWGFELVKIAQETFNPFVTYYKSHYLIEVGTYEADLICLRLRSNQDNEGEIVYISHAKYPRPEDAETEFVCKDFTRLILCAVVDQKIKFESDYYNWKVESNYEEMEEKLFTSILDEILKIEPYAENSPFWSNFIRGY